MKIGNSILPASWFDVSYKNADRLNTETASRVFSSELADSLSFLAEEIETIEPPVIDIGRETWGQLEEARKVLSANITDFEIFCAIIKIYYHVDAAELPCPVALGMSNSIDTQLVAFFKKYKKLTEGEVTGAEHLAGIDELRRYGVFATIHTLANGDPLKYDSLLLLPADVIYMSLLVSKEKATFESNLREEYKRRAKSGAQ